MIQLEQIQELDRKVRAALKLIESLRSENGRLKEKLEGYQKRIDELETVVHAFKEDQGAIEAGIVRALKQLDALEDVLTEEEASEDVEPSQTEAVASNESTSAQNRASDDPERDDTSGDGAGANGQDEVGTEGRSPESPDNGDEESDEQEAPEEEEGDTPDTGESELDIF